MAQRAVAGDPHFDTDTGGHWEQANRYLDGLDAEAVVLDLLCHT